MGIHVGQYYEQMITIEGVDVTAEVGKEKVFITEDGPAAYVISANVGEGGGQAMWKTGNKKGVSVPKDSAFTSIYCKGGV